jgi:histidine triad (HIT) family protein
MGKSSCVFCQIIQGQIPTRVVYKDEQATAFWDIQPIAPVHILIVPNEHYDSLIDAPDRNLLGHLIITARKIAREQSVEYSGYRLVINTGPDAHQSVFHLHVHLIGGMPLAYHVG